MHILCFYIVRQIRTQYTGFHQHFGRDVACVLRVSPVANMEQALTLSDVTPKVLVKCRLDNMVELET